MKNRREDISTDDIIAMYLDGMSQREIAKVVGIAQPSVSERLRKAGYRSGRGRRDVARGGMIASSIPKHEYVVKDAEKQEMAVKNSANVCLVVEDKSFSLKGVVGSYEVSAKAKVVLANIAGAVLELDVDKLNDLAGELRALARNLGEINVGCEMW